jgi:hypothetical protein
MTSPEQKKDSEQKPKGAKPSELVRLARRDYRLLISADDGRAYAVAKRGAAVAVPLHGSTFRAQLAKRYMEENFPVVPSQSALSDALMVLEADAAGHDPEQVFTRVAHLNDGRVVLDLGTADGRCVVVEPGSWRLAARAPVVFRRTRANKPLPVPVSDDVGLALLHNLFNLDEEGVRLLTGWMISVLIHDIPHPVLQIKGEQGTAKTMTAVMLVGLIDPCSAPTRITPGDGNAWAVSAAASWVVCLDNVSDIKPWFSDALCRAVTGDG